MAGITLIALVITIIVLLILAGVTIMMITGNDNVMERAKESRVKSEKADELDTIKLAAIDAIGNRIDAYIDEGRLADSLEGIISSTQVAALRADANGEKTNFNGPWDVTGKNASYRIHRNGYVTVIGDGNNDVPQPPANPQQPEDTSAIAYPTGKTAATAVQGETITITFPNGTSSYNEQCNRWKSRSSNGNNI